MEWKSVDYIQLPVVISPEILKNTISLVISPEIRKWVKIWFWGFFRDDDKSSKSHCNPEFFVSKGVFCSKLLFFAKKNGDKNFLKPLDENLFTTPPQIWWSKKSSNFEHRNFWWHVPDVCTYYKLFEVTLRYLRTLIFCFTFLLDVWRKIQHFLPRHRKKKVVKTGGVGYRHDLPHLS